MNKRSAMLVAAGLVLALIVGGVAMSVGITGPQASQAAPRASQGNARPPIVRTQRRTITVHKKGPAVTSATILVPSSAAPVSGALSVTSGDDHDGTYQSDDDGFEDQADDHGGQHQELGGAEDDD